MTLDRTLLCLALLSTTVVAQVPPQSEPASSQVCRTFGLRSGTVQTLQAPTRPATPFRLTVELGGRPYTLDLQPHDVRAAGFRVLLDDGETLREGPVGDNVTYRGRILERPGPTVTAALLQGRIHATIRATNGAYAIQPIADSKDRYVVFHESELIPINAHAAAAAAPLVQRVDAPRAMANTVTVTKEADIAIDCDYAFYQRNGSDVTRTRNAALAAVNGADTIFRRDLDVRYKVTAIVIRTQAVYTSTSFILRLTEMRIRWNTHHGSIKRDLAVLFSGMGSYSGVITTAYPRTVCHTSVAFYAVKLYGPNAIWNVGFTAMGMGFCWNATLCSSRDCLLMCDFSGQCARNYTLFGQTNKLRMAAFRDTRACLTTVGSYSYFGAGCAGTAGTRCDTVCGSLNPNGGTLASHPFAGEICFGVPGSTASRTICGFEFLTRTAGNTPRTVRCALYEEATSGVPRTVASRYGEMVVGTKAGFYTCTLTAPITIAAGKRFWISMCDTASALAPNMVTLGKTPTVRTYARGLSPQNSNWQHETRIAYPSWRVLCGAAGKGTPLLSNLARPVLGQSFALRVGNARTGRPVLFAFGSSRSQWGALALPFDLGVIGANGCSLLVSPDALLGGMTNASGQADFRVTLPNNASFLDVQFFNQVSVSDPGANGAGMAMTRGGIGRVGR